MKLPPTRFATTGKAFKEAVKQLRPVLPTPRRIPFDARATFQVSPTSVVIGVPSAEVTINAMGSGCFDVEVLLAEFLIMIKERIRYEELLIVGFEHGLIYFKGIRIHAWGTRLGKVQTDDTPPDEPEEGSLFPGFHTPLESSLDDRSSASMASNYVKHRQLSESNFVSYTLLDQMTEAKTCLRRATKNLKPLDITREDLEAILDRRFGSH
jgi:hypothetical protein